MKRSLLATSLLALIIVVLMTVGGAFVYVQNYWTTPLNNPAMNFVVPKGMGASALAEELVEANLLSDSLLFKLNVKLQGQAPALIAGEYAIPENSTPADLLALFASGKIIQHSVTIPEGLTSAEALALIDQEPLLTGSLPAQVAEGSLLPETYLFERGETKQAVLERMQAAMQKALATLWQQRAPNTLLKSSHEAVILASIVEKETGIASERPHIASVFLNRLRIGMPLQSDPTTIYGIYVETGIKKKVLTRSDLARKDAYNTYTIPALPPTPIANPGKAAIEAVLHPDNTKDLYFVANGTGGHSFAATLEEHNKNVAYYRSLPKKASHGSQ